MVAIRLRRAAARIAVELTEHDARHAHAPVELPGALDRVLSGHRVGNVESVGRVGHVANRDKLGHQLVVNVQPAGGIDDHDVETEVARFGDRPLRTRDRIHFARRIVHADGRLCAHDAELLNRGRSLHVGRHQHRMSALGDQPFPKLSRRRRLPRPLQPQQQHDARPLAGRLQAPIGIAEESQHLVTDDLDDLLRRREAPEHILPHRPIAHAIHKGLDDLEVDVGFEQGEPNLSKRGLDALRRQRRLAAERFEDVLKACAERIEHRYLVAFSVIRRLSCSRSVPLSYSSANPYRSGAACGLSRKRLRISGAGTRQTSRLPNQR